MRRPLPKASRIVQLARKHFSTAFAKMGSLQRHFGSAGGQLDSGIDCKLHWIYGIVNNALSS